ncbi:uncharacterized protein EI90DRAFT_3020863 [Cantharellus anzutake]|uniref:uncharacterized protein n=1 Tax=Cantharellus anzutake TaxID=1750568 RepID=UPI0019077F6F|nr:uncharacterized protein EI90DRAFT_3020863 [Cantharellus anzutake]KAF8319161.1 hypothetical protein EI90DRAFT_3020863 [Cantharellus anzutake]
MYQGPSDKYQHDSQPADDDNMGTSDGSFTSFRSPPIPSTSNADDFGYWSTGTQEYYRQTGPSPLRSLPNDWNTGMMRSPVVVGHSPQYSRLLGEGLFQSNGVHQRPKLLASAEASMRANLTEAIQPLALELRSLRDEMNSSKENQELMQQTFHHILGIMSKTPGMTIEGEQIPDPLKPGESLLKRADGTPLFWPDWRKHANHELNEPAINEALRLCLDSPLVSSRERKNRWGHKKSVVRYYYALDKCRQDDIDAKAPGERPAPQNTYKPASHSSEAMSCQLPKFAVFHSLVSQNLSAEQLAHMKITEDPEWITNIAITDEMIMAEDLAALRRFEAESIAYEGDNEDEGVDNEGEDNEADNTGDA